MDLSVKKIYYCTSNKVIYTRNKDEIPYIYRTFLFLIKNLKIFFDVMLRLIHICINEKKKINLFEVAVFSCITRL